VPAEPMRAASDAPWTSLTRSKAVADVLAGADLLHVLHPVGAVESTQDVALQLAHDGAASGTIVIADTQRGGRGRLGRQWDDVPGGGSLAMTVLLDTLPRRATLVPHAVGLAIAASVGRITGSAVLVKWPNDVVVRDVAATAPSGPAKLAGILVQRERVASRDVLLVGVGLNVDLRGVPAIPGRICLAGLREASAVAGGPGSHPADSAGREELLALLLRTLDGTLGSLQRDPEELLAAYRTASDTLGRRVEVTLPDGRVLVGVAKDIDAAGCLVVEVEGRREVVMAGTVRDAAADAGAVPAPSEPAR